MRCLLLTWMTFVGVGCVHSDPASRRHVAEAGITITSSEVTEERLVKLLAEMKLAKTEIESSWGSTFDGPIRIDVDSRYRLPRALIPAWSGKRGVIEFPTDRVNRGTATTVHELVHVFAPNQNRLLAEGLAVYLHEKLHGNSAFPNFSRPLNVAAREDAAKIRIGALDDVATPAPLHTSKACDEQVCYLAAGSFVKFLIERYGMERFRQLYALTPLKPGEHGNSGARERYTNIYAKDRDLLESEWRDWIDRVLR